MAIGRSQKVKLSIDSRIVAWRHEDLCRSLMTCSQSSKPLYAFKERRSFTESGSLLSNTRLSNVRPLDNLGGLLYAPHLDLRIPLCACACRFAARNTGRPPLYRYDPLPSFIHCTKLQHYIQLSKSITNLQHRTKIFNILK